MPSQVYLFLQVKYLYSPTPHLASASFDSLISMVDRPDDRHAIFPRYFEEPSII